MAEMTMYERCQAGMEKEFEEMVEEMVAMCPWMDEEDGERFRQVWAWHWEMTVGDAALVDMEAMASLLWELKRQAEAGGDERRCWAFGQWYSWVCASMRGEEYHWPQMPEALSVWS